MGAPAPGDCSRPGASLFLLLFLFAHLDGRGLQRQAEAGLVPPDALQHALPGTRTAGM
jgi:hypothetical protein